MGKVITKKEIAGLKKLVELDELDADEANSIIIDGTPSLWIESYLKNLDNPEEYIQLRSYQKYIVDRPESTIALRYGRQTGKEQPYSATIITPFGKTTMGEIKVGNYVIGSNGRSAKVLDTFEQGEKDVYKISFDDNTSTECGLEHLWKVFLYNKWEVISIKDILRIYGSRPNIDIPITEAVEYAPILSFMPITNAYDIGINYTDTSSLDDIYFKNSIEIRLDLLRGLQSNSNFNNIKNKPEYIELVQGLGKYVSPTCTKTMIGIKLIRKEKSKCIMVDNEDHTYLTDNFIVTHNTVILSARIVWELFTEKNISAAFFGPTKKHTADIFQYIERMISDVPELASMITSKKQGTASLFSMQRGADALAKIELSNGSHITFFHTQTKRAWEQIRGTQADKLFFDETAIIHENAIAALSGLLTSANDIKLWVQSTPTTKDTWYYQFCMSADVHHHITSMDSPQWNKDKERLARLMAPDEGTYAREYSAEFTSAGWNAFTESAIAEMINNTIYPGRGEFKHDDNDFLSTSQIRDIPGNVFIGLDWNIASNGIKIVLFKQPRTSPEKIYYQEVYSIEDPVYTYTTAVDKLFEIIDEYQPVAIGIDYGYGAAALEMINKKIEMPKYNWVKDIIEIVTFGDILHIETEEFFGTGVINDEVVDINLLEDEKRDIIKMPIKNFMASVLSRMMVDAELCIGPIDANTEKKTLIDELRGVKVEKMSSNGYPVYTKKDNHKFAATLLAVYVYFLKSSRFKIIDNNGKKFITKVLANNLAQLDPFFISNKFATTNSVKSLRNAVKNTSIGRYSKEDINDLNIKNIMTLGHTNTRKAHTRPISRLNRGTRGHRRI